MGFYYKTPAGMLKVSLKEGHICKSEFVDDYGQKAVKEMPIQSFALEGSPFQTRVWKAIMEIPKGKVSTYGWIAHLIGQPDSSRAVGNALGANPVAFIIPCHRVIRSDNSLGGYAYGVERKKALLTSEGVDISNLGFFRDDILPIKALESYRYLT